VGRLRLGQGLPCARLPVSCATLARARCPARPPGLATVLCPGVGRRRAALALTAGARFTAGRTHACAEKLPGSLFPDTPSSQVHCTLPGAEVHPSGNLKPSLWHKLHGCRVSPTTGPKGISHNSSPTLS